MTHPAENAFYFYADSAKQRESDSQQNFHPQTTKKPCILSQITMAYPGYGAPAPGGYPGYPPQQPVGVYINLNIFAVSEQFFSIFLIAPPLLVSFIPGGRNR